MQKNALNLVLWGCPLLIGHPVDAFLREFTVFNFAWVTFRLHYQNYSNLRPRHIKVGGSSLRQSQRQVHSLPRLNSHVAVKSKFFFQNVMFLYFPKLENPKYPTSSSRCTKSKLT